MSHGRGHDQGKGHGHGHAHGHEKGRGPYGNPEDLREYLGKLEGADRAEWQRPDEVIAALALAPGAVAAEVGAGPGYFAIRLARGVGPKGHVFAVEAEPAMIVVLRDRLAQANVHNVTPVLALADDPLLPPASCDLILVVNAFHHFPDPVEYLRTLVRALRPGGRIANIDFVEGELPVGPSPDHKVTRADFLRFADEAGLSVLEEKTLLPYQYFFVLGRR